MKRLVILDDIAFPYLMDKVTNMTLSGREVPTFNWTCQQLENSVPLDRQSLEAALEYIRRAAGVNDNEGTGK